MRWPIATSGNKHPGRLEDSNDETACSASVRIPQTISILFKPATPEL